MVMNPMEAVSYNTKIEKQLFFLSGRIDEIKGSEFFVSKRSIWS